MNGYPLYKRIGFWAGPLLFIILYNFPVEIINPLAQKVIAVAAWMIAWWMTEAVAIPVPALLPMTLFPLLGIMDISDVCSHYANKIVYLFFGGFMIALALEKVNLHKRIALNITKLTGTNANGIILGFMLATALMSMWISNTASTVVMLPIALSVITLLVKDEDGFSGKDRNFALSIMLGIAFAANIGGMATIIGTPPNVVMAGFVEERYNIELGFATWMAMGVPFAILLLLIAYFVIVRVVYPNGLGKIEGATSLIDQEIKKLGKMNRAEWMVSAIFTTTALGWILRAKLNTWFDWDLNDTSIALLGAMAVLVLPTSLNKGQFVLKWQDTSKLPWGILILFGGGLALAKGLAEAGLIDLIGQTIANYESLSVFWIMSLLIFVMLFMTELMSNVALVNIFVPMVAGVAIGLQVDLLYLVIPVTLAASCAFMLPMATPPNAIVFASGYIKVYEMAKVGVVLNIISVLLLIALGKWVVPMLF